jgi:glycosyltransferase involved in cell wall biosynthesis
MGDAGRQRAISDFDWTSIASQTAKLYQEVAGSTVKPTNA